MGKEKRRDTWCFGNFSRETLREVNSIIHAKASAVKPMRYERDMGPLLPFEELVSEASMDNSNKPKQERHIDEVEGCVLPDPHALLHITSRKKAPVKKKSLLVENNELVEFQAQYEELFLKFESQRTVSEIQIDYLTRKLAEADLYLDDKPNVSSTYHLNRSMIHGDATKSLRESEAILVIKQLQEKINMLEVEKSSSQQNLDCVVELATEQNTCAMQKYEEARGDPTQWKLRPIEEDVEDSSKYDAAPFRGHVVVWLIEKMEEAFEIRSGVGGLGKWKTFDRGGASNPIPTVSSVKDSIKHYLEVLRVLGSGGA
ncbi:hypothetical protein U1Q18_013027 [Sarracenia purpurea var. burkii]